MCCMCPNIGGISWSVSKLPSMSICGVPYHLTRSFGIHKSLSLTDIKLDLQCFCRDFVCVSCSLDTVVL